MFGLSPATRVFVAVDLWVLFIRVLLLFEIDPEPETLTALGGVPLLV